MAYDRDDLAATLRATITRQSKTNMPQTVRVEVTDGSMQDTLGWIWGDHAGKSVRVKVGNAFDLTSGTHILECYPPNPDEPGAFYQCIGQVWNGADNSYIPRLRFKGPDGNTYSGEHTHSEYAAASHTHTAGSITDLATTVSGWIQPGTGMVLSYAGSVITIHNTATGGGAGGGSDESLVVGTAGVALARGERVYMDNAALWQKADIDNTAPALGAYRGVVANVSIASAATGDIQILGVSDDFTGLATGSAVYAGTAPGSYTMVRPSPTAGSGQVVIDTIGKAQDATHVLLNMREPLYYMMRTALADDGTATVVHHSDPKGYTRQPAAYIATTEAGESLTTNADTTQDEDVSLNEQTYGSDECSGGTPSASAAGGAASLAVDDNAATYWYSDTSALPHWWQYQLASGKTIQQYTIQVHPSNPVGAPKSWTLEASNTGSFSGEEVTLDTVTDESTWGNGEKRTYQFSNSTSYTYYRFNVSKTQGSDTNGYVTVAEFELMEGNTPNSKLAQGFQVSGNQVVGSVNLWLKKVGSPTGNLTVTIETDSGGDPSGTPVTNGTSNTVAASTLSTSYGWIEFTFGTDPSISDSTQYHLVLTTADSANSDNYVQWGADGSSPGYADGEMKSYAGSWSAESKDACFEVFGVSTTYESPCTIDDWSTSLAVVAVRYDDGADSNPETKTTFKNKKGASADLTLVIELA